MPSTYTNDLRLELIAVGEGAGSAPNDWGSKTNSTLTLIADAFGPGTENLSSDADATLTLADGAADALRGLHLKITSGVSLTATRTITIAPNTVAKVWMIENATTGSQSITIKQGSGATVTIANGATKVLYSDGAGAGAAMTDALADLDLTGTTTAALLDVAGGATNGVSISQGKIELRNGGVQSAIDFFCEVSNAHYVRLQAPVHSSFSGNIVLTLPATDGNAGEFLQTDGSGNMSWGTAGGAYSNFAEKTTNFTASAKDQLVCRHDTTPFTITLPASPTAMDQIVLANIGAATVTVGRNGSNINSLAQNATLVTGSIAQLVYINATIGWKTLGE